MLHSSLCQTAIYLDNWNTEDLVPVWSMAIYVGCCATFS